MQPLVCKMCGSTMLHEKDDLLVCHYCSCKYSAAEISVLKHEKAKAENYFALAQAAYKADDLVKTADYLIKTIESDVSHYEAWLFMGRLALCSATPENVKYKEVVHYCNNAAKYCPEDHRPQLIHEMDEDLTDALDHIFELYCETFETNPSLANARLWTESFAISRLAFAEINYATAIDINIYNAQKASIVNTMICNLWIENIWPDYSADDHPMEAKWQTFTDSAFACILLLETSIALCDYDHKADIARYKNLLAIIDKLLSSCSWKQFRNVWLIDRALDETVKTELTRKANDYRRKIT